MADPKMLINLIGATGLNGADLFYLSQSGLDRAVSFQVLMEQMGTSDIPISGVNGLEAALAARPSVNSQNTWTEVQTFEKSVLSDPTSLTFGSAVTFSWEDGNDFDLTMTDACTLNTPSSNPTKAYKADLRVCHSGGPHVMTLGTGWSQPAGGSILPLSTAPAGAIDWVVISYNPNIGGWWIGVAGRNMS